MKRWYVMAGALALALAGLFQPHAASSQSAGGWITLLDASKLNDWNKVGDANWRVEDGAIVADKKEAKDASFLLSKDSYGDFQLRVEFWASDTANSGIYMRCADATKITDKTCYEANIFDQRPDPTYGTGAIVHLAKVDPMPKAGGKWNTYEITAKGPQLTVVLNGVKTAEITDNQFAKGPIALQYAAGAVKFRKVELKPM